MEGWLLKFLLEHVTHEVGICFAFAGFHDLALEEVEGGGFAGFEVGGALGVGGDDVIAECFDGVGVADLSESFGLDDGFW